MDWCLMLEMLMLFLTAALQVVHGFSIREGINENENRQRDLEQMRELFLSEEGNFNNFNQNRRLVSYGDRSGGDDLYSYKGLAPMTMTMSGGDRRRRVDADDFDPSSNLAQFSTGRIRSNGVNINNIDFDRRMIAKNGGEEDGGDNDDDEEENDGGVDDDDDVDDKNDNKMRRGDGGLGDIAAFPYPLSRNFGDITALSKERKQGWNTPYRLSYPSPSNFGVLPALAKRQQGWNTPYGKRATGMGHSHSESDVFNSADGDSVNAMLNNANSINQATSTTLSKSDWGILKELENQLKVNALANDLVNAIVEEKSKDRLQPGLPPPVKRQQGWYTVYGKRSTGRISSTSFS